MHAVVIANMPCSLASRSHHCDSGIAVSPKHGTVNLKLQRVHVQSKCDWIVRLLSHENISCLSRLKTQSHYAELCEVPCNCCNLTGMTVAIAKSLASANESSRSLTGCCHCRRSCVTASSCQAAARLWRSLYRPHPTSPVNCWSTCPAAMLPLPPFKSRWAPLLTLIVPEP